jgi:hypothetical protein
MSTARFGLWMTRRRPAFTKGVRTVLHEWCRPVSWQSPFFELLRTAVSKVLWRRFVGLISRDTSTGRMFFVRLLAT